MSDIVLSAGVRSNLLQLQKTSELITLTQTRLATGKRVNTALDNPINFFTAQGLTNRANDLQSLLDAMTSGISTLTAADNGITAMTKLVQSAQALTSAARQTTDASVRADLAAQFDTLRTQIDHLAGDSGFNGINLLDSTNSADLTLILNEDGSSTVTIAAVNFTVGGDLAIAAANNGWATTSEIQAASDDLAAALITLRSQAQAFGTNLSTVQIRQEFTKAMINTLQVGADNLTLADSNEEGANLLALQTRQQLSTTALSLASQAAQAVLRLFQ
jgi:flagellin-like hook-associated protein FlgL